MSNRVGEWSEQGQGRRYGSLLLSHGMMVVLAVVLAACSGSRGTTEDGPSTPDPDPAPVLDLAQYEDFDPGAYPDAPPRQTEIEHDVPARLLDGTPAASGPRTAQGYRIQIYSSRDKGEADRYLDRATEWWLNQQRTGAFDGVYAESATPPPVYLVYVQPYYRVRVGNFADRSEAAATLRLARSRFPDAFIVPDRVTLTR